MGFLITVEVMSLIPTTNVVSTRNSDSEKISYGAAQHTRNAFHEQEQLAMVINY